MWKQIGVQTELFNTDGKIHYADLKQGSFQVARAGWIADYNDPQNFLFLMESKSGPINYSKFNNEEYDGLMAEDEAVSDLDQRATILRDAEEVALEGQPVEPICSDVSNMLVPPTVVGRVVNVTDTQKGRGGGGQVDGMWIY